MKRTFIIIMAGIVIALVADDAAAQKSEPAAQKSTPVEKKSDPAAQKSTPIEKKSDPAAQKEIAVIETSMGTIEAELYRADAPKTVENFVKLAEKKYFNGVIFHRVSKGFVIQGGDPTGTGTGGKSIYGGEFADELNPATPSYKTGYVKGVLAMANRGPNTNTSQFFIMLQDAPRMPKNYTIFGKVINGIEVVDKIGEAEIIPQMGARDGKPKTDIVMKSVTIRREPAAAAPKK